MIAPSASGLHLSVSPLSSDRTSAGIGRDRQPEALPSAILPRSADSCCCRLCRVASLWQPLLPKVQSGARFWSGACTGNIRSSAPTTPAGIGFSVPCGGLCCLKFSLKRSVPAVPARGFVYKGKGHRPQRRLLRAVVAWQVVATAALEHCPGSVPSSSTAATARKDAVARYCQRQSAPLQEMLSRDAWRHAPDPQTLLTSALLFQTAPHSSR